MEFVRTKVQMPKVKPISVRMGLGLDVVSSPLSAKPGTAKAAMNYEVAYSGGFERTRGFEAFDGRARPSDAQYTALAASASFSGVALGDVVHGGTSGATGRVVAIESAYLVVTMVTGTFEAGEDLDVSGAPIGEMSGAAPAITGAQDNEYMEAAANAYREQIAAVPGSGPIRGIATLGSSAYAWRDNAAGTAMVIHKSSVSGWTEVPMYYKYRFTSGSSQYTEGESLTQGAVTATVKRVLLESGSWSGSAAGVLIVTLPSGGNFANGAATGGGACTLTGVPATSAEAKLTLLPGGRVETDTWNFYGSADTRRLYGCDTVNPEFEFDGDVWAPLNTGMSVRAKFVRAHKNYLWFAFRGSLQKSAAGDPYVWSAVLGAAELGVGDEITGLATTPGDNVSSAMLVACRDSAHVLYGSVTDDFKLVPLSREAGVNAYSLQSLSAPVGHDQQGFRVFKPTQSFGNFAWDIASRLVDPLSRSRTPTCSVFSPRLTRYRCFFSDGTALSGTPVGKEMAWSQINYGIQWEIAYSGELAGDVRVFYGDADGWVYEGDVGRSFNGQPIQCAIVASPLMLGSSPLEKRWRDMEVEATCESAFVLYASAEFNDGSATTDPVSQQEVESVGTAGLWDVGLWDRARWDAPGVARHGIEVPGLGYGISPIFYSNSAVELSHTINSITLTYTPTKMRKL